MYAGMCGVVSREHSCHGLGFLLFGMMKGFTSFFFLNGAGFVTFRGTISDLVGGGA